MGLREKFNVRGKIVSPLEKVLYNIEPTGEGLQSLVFKNARLNFQLAFKADCPWTWVRNTIKVEGDLSADVTLRTVEDVPVRIMPMGADEYYIGKTPDNFPDVLKPLSPLGVVLPSGSWRSVFVTVENPNGLKVGNHKLKFTLYYEDGEPISELEYEFTVVDQLLEDNDLIVTNWIHYDCICVSHKVEPFTDEFYKVFESYLKAYLDSGANMLFVPLFTPPLDTAIGGERKTTQLVNVEKSGDKYSFDFTGLVKFIKFVLERGIKYIEFSHLFSQWGGKACPKIIATVDGKEEKIFGWHTNSDSKEYAEFLAQFIPKLVIECDKLGVKDRCYLHLTDEPNKDSVETYEKCSKAVKTLSGGMKIMDAMSEPEFYSRGLLDIPVVYTPSFNQFKEKDRPNLFAYYCGLPTDKGYSNRFINMPALRQRVLGAQLYLSGVGGFLHWGFNFYNTYLSLDTVDPYAVTDAGYYYPAGDGFIVYPLGDGAIGSIRAEIQFDAVQDYRLLKTLEKKRGREFAVNLLRKYGFLGFNEYPREEKVFAALIEEITQNILDK